MSWSDCSARARSRGGEHAVADGGEIARPAAADREPRQRAGKIGRGVERARSSARGAASLDKARDGVEPSRDRRRIGQRRRKPLRQQPRAGRGHGAVDGVEQRAAPLAATSVRISSRLARVAWSIAMVAPALSRIGGDSGGRLPICVRST